MNSMKPSFVFFDDIDTGKLNHKRMYRQMHRAKKRKKINLMAYLSLKNKICVPDFPDEAELSEEAKFIYNQMMDRLVVATPPAIFLGQTPSGDLWFRRSWK